jgi:hypothetical protein
MVLTLEKYSEKSLAVFGDTENYSDKLVQMGGKYISNLKGRPGWIFYPNMKKMLETFIAEQQPDDDIPPLVDTPVVSNRKDIYSALAEIQTMMSLLQAKINAVMDLAEKTDKPAECDPVDEDIVAPVSLLRRK